MVNKLFLILVLGFVHPNHKSLFVSKMIMYCRVLFFFINYSCVSIFAMEIC